MDVGTNVSHNMAIYSLDFTGTHAGMARLSDLYGWIVYHPTTNQARCEAAPWINTNALPLSYIPAIVVYVNFYICFFCLCRSYSSAGGLLFLGCPCVHPWWCTRSLLMQYLGTTCENVTKFTTSVQLGTRMNWYRFWSQKVTAVPHMVKKDSGRHFCTHLWNASTLTPCIEAVA